MSVNKSVIILLNKFVQSLWNRGLLTKSPEKFDYEWVIWDFFKKTNKRKYFKCSRCGSEIKIISGEYKPTMCMNPFPARTSKICGGAYEEISK